MEEIKTKEEIAEEAKAFASQLAFRNPENPSRVKPGLKPANVFGKLGFSEVQLENLNTDLQKAIQNRRGWYGHPLQGANGNIKNPNVKLFQSRDGESLYCIEDKGDRYAWSKIEKSKNGYMIHVIGSKDTIGDVINSFSFYEIAHAQNAAYFPKFTAHEKEMISIPAGGTKVVEETRDQIIGLA